MTSHPDQNPSSQTPLESWKEIAAYLQRDVSTAMRWEKSEGLPVHRHQHSSRASVYAYPKELEAWRAQRRPDAGQELQPPLWRRGITALAGGVALLAVVAILQWGPILHPPDPLAEAADVGDGVSLRQVWAGTDADTMGSISHDGRYLSFVNWTTGDLALRDLVTAESRDLTDKGTWEENDEFAESSIFSPDGRHVAYAWFNDRFFYDLRLIGIEGVAGGQEPKVLYSNPELYYLVPVAFFPDGKRILTLLQRRDRSVQIGILGTGDQSARVLKTVDWRWPGKTALSPDGRYILYDFPVGEGEAPRDIFLLTTDGGREIPLVSHPANDEVLGWTPDGSAVLFTSDRGGERGAWLLPVTGGKAQGPPRVVKSELDVAMAIGFSGDGSFFYGFRTGMQDIYAAPLDLEAAKLLGAPAKLTQRFVGSNRAPAWSANGKYLAYLSRRKEQRPGTYAIAIRTVETGQERDIHPRTGYIEQLRWAPDGRSLYFASPDERSRWTVFRLDIEAEELTTLVPPEEGQYYFSVVVSPDGRTLYYGAVSSLSEETVLRTRDLNTGDEREIYKVRERFRFDLSPDGRLLALIQRGHRPEVTLNVMPAEGGEFRELLRLQSPEGMGRSPIWTADSRHVLFWKRPDVRSEGPEGELWSLPIDGGAPRRITFPAEYRQYIPQSLHPDGRQIALAAGRDRREIWAMENFLPEPEAAK